MTEQDVSSPVHSFALGSALETIDVGTFALVFASLSQDVWSLSSHILVFVCLFGIHDGLGMQIVVSVLRLWMARFRLRMGRLEVSLPTGGLEY